jgi:hypothetical protein
MAHDSWVAYLPTGIGLYPLTYLHAITSGYGAYQDTHLPRFRKTVRMPKFFRGLFLGFRDRLDWLDFHFYD